MRKIAIICLLASISVLASAQKITITPEVTSPDERAVVDFDNMICAIEGTKVIYRITVEECDSIDSVSVCQYSFNEVDYTAIYTLEDGVITIEDISVPLVVGSNQFSFKLTLQEKGKDDLTELTQVATTIQIYPIPTFQMGSEPSSFVFNNETGELSWTAYCEGGAIWDYKWTSTEDQTGSGETFVHPSITNYSTIEKVVTVTLSVTNYAPDGTTIWYSYSVSWTITISPVSDISISVTPNTVNNPYKLFQGDSWDLAVSAVDGNTDGWKIEWLNGDNNNLLGQGFEYKVTGSSLESIENMHVILHATYTAPEGDNGVLFDEVYHYYVRFYPIPQIAFSNSYPTDVLNGEKIQMGVELIDTQFAEDYVIEYEWNENDGDGTSYLFEAINGGNMGSIQEIVTVKCYFGLVDSDANSRNSNELSHTFIVWPKAFVDINANETDRSNPHRKFQDGKLEFKVDTHGGYPTGWNIVWKDENGKELGQGDKYIMICDASSDRVQEKHVILTITNRAQGRTDLWFEHSYNYYASFYPVPTIEFANSYPQDVLDGEKIQMEVKCKNLEKAEDYVINWEWNGNSKNDSSYLFEAVNSDDMNGIKRDITVKCSFGLINSDAQSSSQELSHTFFVWRKAYVDINANETDRSNPHRQFQDGKLEFKVDTHGGYPTGWNIVWKDENGNEVGQGEKYTMKCDVSSDEVQEKHVILTITNKAQGRTDLWFEHSYNYHAAFYPAPIVKFEREYPHNIKHGDKVVLSLTVLDPKGNTLGDAYNWNYSWNDGQSNNDSYEFVGENQSNDDGVTTKIAVDCSIELKGTNLKQTYSREADFVVWPLPKVITTDIVDRVGCGGLSYEYSIPTSGGKKDGWSYEWSLNNINLDVNRNTLNLSLNNPSETDPIINHYKVRVTNVCDNEVWFDAEYPFTVTVYPEPKVPDRIIVLDENRGVEVSKGIREGNTMILHCDKCTGGNPNAWSYQWLRNNSLLGTNNEMVEKIISNYSGSGKDNNLMIEYNCLVENTYNTILWKKQEYKKEIRVYRKPQTPTGLHRKGNGTSGTWIATCGIDDSSLGANDYYLVFGYRDANGNMHDVTTMRQQSVGELRWSSSQIAFNGNAYVYALWKYDDGAEVTSGLCMESTIDENWDGSTYDGSTRSVISEATNIDNAVSVQTQDDYHYYSLDGLKISQPKRGLNIVRSKNGQVVKIISNK